MNKMEQKQLAKSILEHISHSKTENNKELCELIPDAIRIYFDQQSNTYRCIDCKCEISEDRAVLHNRCVYCE